MKEIPAMSQPNNDQLLSHAPLINVRLNVYIMNFFKDIFQKLAAFDYGIDIDVGKVEYRKITVL